MTTALVFPGMGPTRFSELGRFLMADAVARRMLREAGEVLGYDVAARFADASDEAAAAEAGNGGSSSSGGGSSGGGGDYDEATQVAFLVTCLALAGWARTELGVRPDLCAGPSFGAKTVTAFTGALSFEDAVLLTARLARTIDSYIAAEHPDVVTQSVVRAPMSRLGPILAELTELGEWYDLACEVDEGFYLLNLRSHRVRWLTDRLRAAGALPLYAMRPPMHSRLFQGLRDRVEREVLPALRFADPEVPIVSDQSGAVLTTAAQVRTMLLDGLVWPVRWPAVAGTFTASSVSRVVIAGPDAMFGRVGCITRAFEVVAVDHRLPLRPVRAARTRAATPAATPAAAAPVPAARPAPVPALTTA